MAAAQHTPGPWESAHAGEGVRGGGFLVTEFYVRLPDADFSLAADIVGADMKPSEANAHLIAASPDLLSELRNTSFLLMSACLVIEDADARETALAAVKRARAAIAKATGSAA